MELVAVKVGTAPKAATPKVADRVAVLVVEVGAESRQQVEAGTETATGEETRNLIIRNCATSHQDLDKKCRRFLLH